jgi:CheY-like chemotaxis protein
VRARSEGLRRGTTFTVRLPLAVPSIESDARSPGESAERAPTRQRRVLVLDDNQDAADLLGLMLESVGYETTVVYNGRAALDAARRTQPDIAILDLGMPDMNGYEVARALRHRPEAATLGLIALTGWGSREDKDAAIEAGFDVHLTKPIEAGALRAALGEVERLRSVSS